MCFSATSSFVLAGGLTAVGIATLRRTRYAEHRLFAVVPLLFAVHQALEGIVWLTLEQRGLWHNLGVYGFLFFALMFWPLYVPLVIRRLESVPWRRGLLAFFAIVGGGIGLAALREVLLNGASVAIVNHHIRYLLAPAGFFTEELGLAVCSIVFIGSFFASSQRVLWLMGLAVLGFEVYTYAFMPEAVVSAWCFFAAALSALAWWVVPRLR